jgi:hypothetical protein
LFLVGIDFLLHRRADVGRLQGGREQRQQDDGAGMEEAAVRVHDVSP